jgi:S-adenosylmethionine/arginine decarboxylase-like enzyme
MSRLNAEFSGCDSAALGDVAGLVRALRRAAAAAGATGVQSAEERFAPDGFVAAIATRESEARLRTIPERAACLVEFHCDESCRAEAFATVLGIYLHARIRSLAAPVAVHRVAPERPADIASAPASA